jgi:2-dehydro-3-deoxyphosphogluconate aldolase/(4S)-4-hydroxy-2-oxoglutarate aldolase
MTKITAREACELNRETCTAAPVVPVLVVDDVKVAVPLAEALVAGGLPALEVTLRTPAALDVIRAMATVRGGIVGAGTLITPQDARNAKEAGAKFGVSPGSTPALVKACEEIGLPLLAGAVTCSEVMALMALGYDLMKFFPAEAAGGVNAVKSIGGPLAGVSFCPTGGITLDSAPSYLKLPNVICVGGSWVAPKGLVEAGDWDGIQALAEEASAL